ncbi:MAG: hypothetical protein AAGA21_16115 [Pseudomonadota bacterium]
MTDLLALWRTASLPLRLAAGLVPAALLVTWVGTLVVNVQQTHLNCDIEADESLGTCGDLSARDIIINNGFNQDQIIALMHASRADGGDQSEVVALAGSLGIADEAVQTFFDILETERVPDDQLLDKFAAIAENYVSLRDREARWTADSAQVQTLLDQAQQAIAEGDFDAAEQVLTEAEASGISVVQQAAVQGYRGEISLTRLRYLEAADHFSAAARLLPPEEKDPQIDYLAQQARALHVYGYDANDATALQNALTTYQTVVGMVDRNETPREWARVQWQIASVLHTLGERRPNNELLAEAVATYEQVLEVYTREKAPHDWGKTQLAIGAVLSTLGARKQDRADMENAVKAYHGAAEAFDREEAPLDWSRAKTGLGFALAVLGEREIGNERLAQAVDAFRAALQGTTLERMPMDWAKIQTGLGYALAALGERGTGIEQLTEAVEVFEQALEVYSRERVPLEWARIQTGLGFAFTILGERQGDGAHYQKALEAVTAARVIFVEDRGLINYRDSLDHKIDDLNNRLMQINASDLKP